MSRIDDLLARMCPRGVETRRLGEIAQLVRGNGMPRADFTDVGVGCIHYGQIYMHYGAWATKTISCVSPATATRLAKVNPGDVIITNTSENLDDVCKAVAWLGEDQIVTGGHATVVKHDQDPKYLSYWFQTPNFSEQKRRLASGTKVIDVSATSLARVEVPMPPIEVQREIVRVLDAFAALEAELEAELEARRRQYAHYRESLLAPAGEDRARWVRMGDVGQFIRGRRFTKSDVVTDGIASIHYGEIYTSYGVSARRALTAVNPELRSTLRFAKPGDIVIAAVGETVEDVCKAVAWLGDEEVAIHDDCFAYRHSLNPKFVAYYMQTAAFHSEKAQYVARAKVKRMSGENLAKLHIPVPSVDEQERVVAALDAFEALMSDLSVGLPAELAARRKQYEHYRNRLLTFPEAS